MRSTVFIKLFSVLLIFLIFTSVSVSSTTIGEIKQQLEIHKKKKEEALRKAEKAKQQMKQSNNNINALDNMEDRIQKEKSAIDGNISETIKMLGKLDDYVIVEKNAMQQVDNDIEEINKKLGEMNGKFKERIRIIYEHGPVAYLEVLLGSNDITDFFSRLTLLGEIIQHDKKMMKIISEEKKLLFSKKAEKAKRLEDLKEAKMLRANQMDDLQEQSEIKSEKIGNIQTKKDKEEEQLQNAQKIKEEQLRIVEEETRIEEQQNEIYRQLTVKEQSINKRTFNGGKFAWPVSGSGTITSTFGYRTDPKPGFHKGVDIAISKGTPILAANDGAVIAAGFNSSGYGNYIIIDHGGGIATLYAHCSRIDVSKGDEVKRGEQIGTVGSTGFSTGPHLHFEVIVNGKNVEPLGYIR